MLWQPGMGVPAVAPEAVRQAMLVFPDGAAGTVQWPDAVVEPLKAS